MSPLEAVAATRFHHQLLPPDLITQSPSLPLSDITIEELTEKGYRVEAHSFEFGDIQVIWRDGDKLRPASDPRDRGVSKIVELPSM